MSSDVNAVFNPSINIETPMNAAALDGVRFRSQADLPRLHTAAAHDAPKALCGDMEMGVFEVAVGHP